MATEISAGEQPSYNQVAAIVTWLRKSISYRPGSSDISLSAVEANSRQVGVCRDLAHLGIALCRSLSIPARMVVGYLYGLEPMDLHAWFEAYVGGRWYTFDATQAELKGGYVAVGYGAMPRMSPSTISSAPRSIRRRRPFVWNASGASQCHSAVSGSEGVASQID